MAPIRTVSVVLSAKAQKFEQGMQSGSNSLRKFDRAAASSGGGLGKLGASATAMIGTVVKLGAAAAAAAIAIGGVFAKKSLDNIDKLSKLSSRMGGSVQSFRQLDFAAKLVGTDLDAVTKAMDKLQDNIGMAMTQPTSETARAFKKLGLDARELAALGVDESFTRVSTALRNLDTQAERTHFGRLLLGRGGVGLQNLINADLPAMAKQFDAIGGFISDEDAIQVEKFNDSVTRLVESFTGLVDVIVAKLAPVLTPWIDDLGSLIGMFSDWVAGVLPDMIDLLVTGLARMLDLGNLAKAVFTFDLDAFEAFERGDAGNKLISRIKEAREDSIRQAEERRSKTEKEKQANLAKLDLEKSMALEKTAMEARMKLNKEIESPFFEAHDDIGLRGSGREINLSRIAIEGLRMPDDPQKKQLDVAKKSNKVLVDILKAIQMQDISLAVTD